MVLAEHGGCLSSVDRDRELRIWSEREGRRHECETRGWSNWNEREARRNECETRWTAYLERARSLTERV